MPNRFMRLILVLLAAFTVTSRPALAQRPAPIEPMHVHHVHLNSVNPSAAAAYYPKAFPVSATKTTFNGYEAVKTGNVYLLFTKVNTPPQTELTGPQTSVWHFGWNTPDSVHYAVEAERRAYADRNTYLGDPAFVKNPLDRLLSKDYAAEIRAHIQPDKATASKEVGPGVAPHEKAETTHYSIIDQEGNAATVTYSLNGIFGAAVMPPGTGVLLNDVMDDFTIKPGASNLYGLVQGEANAIAPGKTPLSSMAPTLVSKDGRVMLALGSPGGSRIITIVLETALNMIDYDMQPQEAVDAPRIHHQWLPDEVFVEPFALSADTAKLLQGMGYKLTTQTPWGAAEVVAEPVSGPATAGLATSGNDSTFGGNMRQGFVYGATDDRRPAGLAAGE